MLSRAGLIRRRSQTRCSELKRYRLHRCSLVLGHKVDEAFLAPALASCHTKRLFLAKPPYVHEGKIYEITGPEALFCSDIASTLSKVLAMSEQNNASGPVIS